MNLNEITREEKETLYISKASQLNIRHLEIGEDLENALELEDNAHKMSDVELDKAIKDIVGQIKFEKGHTIFVWIVIVIAIILIPLLFKFL